MIGYVTLGTNDLARATQFYDQLLSELGASRFMETEQFIAWSAGMDKPGISVTTPFDGNPASVGNGVMVALEVGSPEKVNAVYNKGVLKMKVNQGLERLRGFMLVTLEILMAISLMFSATKNPRLNRIFVCAFLNRVHDRLQCAGLYDEKPS